MAETDSSKNNEPFLSSIALTLLKCIRLVFPSTCDNNNGETVEYQVLILYLHT